MLVSLKNTKINIRPNGKGDGNDGEPDARRKLEFEKKGQKLVGIEKLWMVWDDI